MDMDLEIKKGKTFNKVLRWATDEIVYAPITGITQTAPVVIEAPNHGLVNDWLVTVVSVKGMTQINSVTPTKLATYTPVTVIDASTVELNAVNASEYSAYKSGGYVQYQKPVDMAGMSARMQIKDKVGGTLLYSLDTVGGGIAIDNVGKKITLTIAADVTEDFTFKKGVYDIEFIDASDAVVELVSGKVTVLNEVTT
jgi:hypothetical protein